MAVGGASGLRTSLTRQAIAQKGILQLRTTLRHPAAAAPEARRARLQHIGRPKALDEKKATLARRMHRTGESASTIATALG